MPIKTINNYTLGFSYTTFTWPSSPTWTDASSFGTGCKYTDITVTGIQGGTGATGSCPMIDVRVTTAGSKSNIEAGWSHIIAASCPSDNKIRFYTDDSATVNSLLAGATIQVLGF